MSARCPEKIFHDISTLLSGDGAGATGFDELLSDAQSAQRHRTFQCSIPVLRLSLIRMSRER